MQTFQRLFRLSAVAAMAAISAGAYAADPIKIGVAVGLSGANSVVAPAVVQSSQLAVEEINAAGGILGRRVEYTSNDTQSQPQVAKALAVISPDPGDGKSFLAANLAVALAQLGGRMLLVDADMRGPRQHEIFQVPNKAGLSSVLSGRTSSQVIQQVEGVPGLFVLPVGATPPNPLELVERPAFALLMRELLNKFDHVLVDTPAAAYGADAGVIAARCGAALLLARKNESRLAGLAELIGSFEGCPVRITGVVVNEF